MKREKYLSKAIICSLLTASAISVSATAMAAETSTPPQQNVTTDTEDKYISKDSNVKFVSDGTAQTVDNETLYVSPEDQEGAAHYDGLSVIRVENANSSLTVTNSTISGGGIYVGSGAELTIDGSTIKDGQYYEKNDDGTVTASGGTEFDADGGKITVSNSTINSTIVAENGGTITLNNTNLSIGQYSDGSIVADSGSTINLNSGTYDTTGMDFIGAMKAKGADDQTGGKINLIGGRLVADNLRAQTNGSLITSDAGEEDNSEIVKGGIVLKDSGIIKTQTGEIFANSAANKTTDSGAVTNDYIDYQGGVLEFTDSEYTIDYLVKANENMNTASSGKTSIAMLGKLVDSEGSAVGSITVDQAAGIGNAKLDTVTVKANEDAHTLAVTNNTAAEDGVQKANSFNAAVLDLNNTIGTIKVENGKQLGLGGGQGGELVQNAAKDDKLAINVNDATLNISRDGVEADVASNLTADITAQNGATVNSVGGNNTVKGNVTVNNATLNVNGGSSLTVDGTLTGGTDSKIMVGNSDSAGTLIAGDVSLSDGTMFLDPVWQNGQDISDGSKAALVLKENKVDGNLVVGENSVLSLGTTDTAKAENAFAKTGETWGDGENDVLSAVYVEGSHDVSTGALIANPKATKDTTGSDGTVNFSKNSILIVDGTTVKGEGTSAALTGITNLSFDGKLYIDNADKGTYHILSKADGTPFKGSIEEKQILSNIDLLKFNKSDENGDVTASYKDANTVYTGSNSLVIDDVVNKTLQSDKITSGNAAYDFFRKAIDGNVNGTTAA